MANNSWFRKEEGNTWRPTFDWMIKDSTNLLKLLEGQFERKPKGKCDYSKWRTSSEGEGEAPSEEPEVTQ
jgi:hypothetical protein